MNTTSDGDKAGSQSERAVLFDWLHGIQRINDEHKVLTATELGILLVAATFADTNAGDRVHPGVRSLAKKSGSTVPKVVETLAKARTLGVIERTWKSPVGGTKADRYRLVRPSEWLTEPSGGGVEIDSTYDKGGVEIDSTLVRISIADLPTSSHQTSTHTTTGSGDAWAQASVMSPGTAVAKLEVEGEVDGEVEETLARPPKGSSLFRPSWLSSSADESTGELLTDEEVSEGELAIETGSPAPGYWRRGLDS